MMNLISYSISCLLYLARKDLNDVAGAKLLAYSYCTGNVLIILVRTEVIGKLTKLRKGMKFNMGGII